MQAILEGKPSPIPWNELLNTSLVTFGVLESMRTGKSVHVNRLFSKTNHSDA